MYDKEPSGRATSGQSPTQTRPQFCILWCSCAYAVDTRSIVVMIKEEEEEEEQGKIVGVDENDDGDGIR